MLTIPSFEAISNASLHTTAPIQAAGFEQFVLAGHALFTVRNRTSGNRLTYQVTMCKDNPELFFVAVLNGPDNTTNYQYLGTIRRGEYHHGVKSTIGQDAPSAVVFPKLWARRHQLPACVEVFHEGRCGRCGRVLTTPESITQSYGPECIKFINQAA